MDNTGNKLIDNHNLTDLLNPRRLEAMAKSVSPEFLCNDDDDSYDLYLYNLIAYILLNSKNEDKIIDDKVIGLLAFCECKMDSDEYIAFNKDEYINLMDMLKDGGISSSLSEMLYVLYVYKTAYKENEYLINMGNVNASLLEDRNKLLVEAINNVKKKIVPEEVRMKMNKYILLLKSSNRRKIKVKVIKNGAKKTTSVFNVRKNWGKKRTYYIRHLVDSGKIIVVNNHDKKEESGLQKVRKKVTQ